MSDGRVLEAEGLEAGLLEAVVNVAEGRRAEVLAALVAACGDELLDVHTDPDHDRTVFTLVGAGPAATEAAVRRLADAVATAPPAPGTDGVHPRIGVLDVVPFVALGTTAPDVAVAAARRFADWLAATHAVPVFRYDRADPEGRSLPDTRRDAFVTRAPDAGPPGPHPTLGATAVGARAPMIAVNCELASDDLTLARRIAGAVRERDGGLPGVRALGLSLASRGTVQVSMNLVDLDATGLEPACTRVRDLAADAGVGLARVEVVGLVPAGAFDRTSAGFRRWSGVSAAHTIEAARDRVARVAARDRADRDDG